MQKNEISLKELSAEAQMWLGKMNDVLVVKEYGVGSIKSYMGEMILLFKYYNHMPVSAIRQGDIEHYIRYVKEVHGVGRAKCRSVAQACSFFLSG